MAKVSRHLPPEVQLHILDLVDYEVRYLSQLMRVCRAWYHKLFPMLYKQVYLSWNAPIFAARILEDCLAEYQTSNGELFGKRRVTAPMGRRCVTNLVTNLVLDTHIPQSAQRSFSPLESNMLTAALPMLSRLKRFEWSLPWLPEDPELFVALNKRCPNIEAFTITIPTDMNRYGDSQFSALFCFRKLKFISVKDHGLSHSQDYVARIPPALMTMIVKCSELEHLELDLAENVRGPEYSVRRWNLYALYPVMSHTFHGLKTFLLKGKVDTDDEFFFDPDDSNKLLWYFIARHPKLHTLELPPICNLDRMFSTIQHTAKMMRRHAPLLHHLTGPTYLVGAFLQLEGAQHLESLGVCNAGNEDIVDMLEHVQSYPALPDLKQLKFECEHPLDSEVFEQVVRRAPNVTVLTVGCLSGDFVAIARSILGLVRLRTLSLGRRLLSNLCSQPSPQSQEAVVRWLGLHCPNLSRVYVFPEGSSFKFDYQSCWYLRRDSNHGVNLQLFETPRRQEARLDPDYHGQALNQWRQVESLTTR